MLHRQTHDDLTWIDVVSPTHEEIRSLMDEFSIDPLIIDELMIPSLRNRVDARDDYFYVVLHFPARGMAKLAQAKRRTGKRSARAGAGPPRRDGRGPARGLSPPGHGP